MSGWLKRFGLHLAAALGATGIFVAAAAVGASQTREQVAAIAPVPVSSPVAKPQRPSPIAGVSPSPTPQPNKLGPERSLSGSIKKVLPTDLNEVGVACGRVPCFPLA